MAKKEEARRIETMMGPMVGIMKESIPYLEETMKKNMGQEEHLKRMRKSQRPHLDFQPWLLLETLL